MAKRHYLAFDFGAESGRAIVGTLDAGKLTLQELHRFENRTTTSNGKLLWDAADQWEQIKTGLKRSASLSLDGIGVDTWGVDFALVDGSGELKEMPRMYRDPSANAAFAKALARVSRSEIYQATGVQFLSFNTLYQLLARQGEDAASLQHARMLLMPDWFNFLLCGVAKAEQTIASTTQMLDSRSMTWAHDLLKRFEIPLELLPELVPPATVLGRLRPQLAIECGIDAATDVIAVGGHDTASAVASVPAQGESWCYISSGTWSLLGVELDAPIINDQSLESNFTNEVGLGNKIRFLKNIAGLWLVQECRRQFASEGDAYSYAELMQMTGESEPFRSLIEPDAPAFSEPGEMPAKIVRFCRATGQRPPATRGDIIRVCLDSLAFKYQQTLTQLEQLTGKRLHTIHIIGGGSQNELLNQITADVCQRDVYAGPVEATAIGNILAQAIAKQHIAGLSEARAIVRESFPTTHFAPQPLPRLEQLRQQFSGFNSHVRHTEEAM